MSKLLKVIVNTLLLLAILSAGALVIPPFAGITTLVSDGMGNTNISRGAVTYAKKTDMSSVATGDKILVDDNSGKYIYTIPVSYTHHRAHETLPDLAIPVRL